ncbi:carbohydrate ABC transporter permease [Cohnella fermenti]|uniref:Carbohydrate ABC transporter permease n=1 Tax=Cohnella fermenti TaxID=2565925 RepID=A0A4S4BL55_9BACL|nr:carbohydrate ABC transporter permease [Cohnella fermenti]THF75494.1 carbohydrate ABC transporter permease [Cohnella fermenti]
MALLRKVGLSAVIYAIAILWAIPLVWVVYMAFRPQSLSLSSGISLHFTFDNLKCVWEAAPFLVYFTNTLIIVIGIFAVQMVTVTMAAYAFARLAFAGKTIVFLVFLVQIMIPVDVLIFPEYMVLKELSLLDTKLGIMIPYFGSALGIFLMRQHFMTIPADLEEAAQMEGATKWRILWTIYFPLARPALLSFGLVSVSYHWNNFVWPLIVTNSVENRPLTVGLALFAKAAETGAQWSVTTAATLLVIAPLLIGFLFFQRKFINSFVSSGVK